MKSALYLLITLFMMAIAIVYYVGDHQKGRALDKVQHEQDSISRIIDSLQYRSDSLLRRGDSLSVVIGERQGRIDALTASLTIVSQRYENLRSDLSGYSDDQHIRFLADQLSQ